MRAEVVKQIARECGFELAGIASADPPEDFALYQAWVAGGMAGEMRYLTDRRAEVRRDARNLLPEARSVICVGKSYNHPTPPDQGAGHGIISRYAWGPDYHGVMRASLEHMVARLREENGATFGHKICVDTAPLLERTFARLAGLGWIGKNTCLINEPLGSWFFLGELITSLELTPDSPPPDRCGSCTRCIDACPTQALVPAGDSWALDSRRCIAYFTIELRGSIPVEYRESIGPRIFGCDICQDVCPWNTKGSSHGNSGFAAGPSLEAAVAPALEVCARLSQEEFDEMFRKSAVARPRYAGFLRNVAVAMGNSGLPCFYETLQNLAEHADPVVAEHARWGLRQLSSRLSNDDQQASAFSPAATV